MPHVQLQLPTAPEQFFPVLKVWSPVAIKAFVNKMCKLLFSNKLLFSTLGLKQ